MRLREGDDDLSPRTKQFALRVVKCYAALPKSTEAQILGKQLLRAGTSVGAQIAEAGFAKSSADFVSKIDGALQEMRETRYWLELIADSGLIKRTRLQPLLDESSELTAMMAVMAGKSRKRAKT